MVEFGRIHVKIRGLTPLLMNRLDPSELKDRALKGPGKIYDPEKVARRKAYITVVDGKEQLYIPNRWIYSMMVKAAGQYRLPGKRTSLSSILAGTIRIEPEKILLGHCNYEIDERPVVIQKNRVLAWRPKIKEWEVEFDIIYNKMFFPPESLQYLRQVLEDGGIRLGIGDFRPQHKGWFGTFEVVEFEVVE